MTRQLLVDAVKSVDGNTLLTGLHHIETIEADSQASMDFSAFDASVFAGYMWVLDEVTPASDATLQLLTSSDGGSTYDNSASDYRWCSAAIGNTIPIEASAADAVIELGGRNVDISRGSGVSGELFCYNPDSTIETVFSGHLVHCSLTSIVTPTAVKMAGMRDSKALVDAVRFSFSSSVLFDKGRIAMFGWVSN